MTDSPSTAQDNAGASADTSTSLLDKVTSNENMPKIVYILYLVGLIFPLTGMIGVVLSYIYKSEAPEWMQSHYQFQIRTFWIGALYMLVGTLLSIVLIGYLVLLFWWVWLAVRSIKGMRAFDRGQAHPNPKGWMF